MREKGYVYIIKESGKGYLKIGVSADPLKRLGNLQIGNPHSLILILQKESSMMKVHEANIHKSLNRFLVRGEWFCCDEDIAINTVSEITDGDVVLTEYCYTVKWNDHGPQSRIVYGKRNARSLKTRTKGKMFRCNSEGVRITKKRMR